MMDYVLYPQAAKRRGFHTGMIGKFTNGTPWSRGSTWQDPSFDDWHVIDHPQTAYLNYKLIENGSLNAYGNTDADHLTDVISTLTVDYIEANVEPFCLSVSHFAPHPTTSLATTYPDRCSSLYTGVTADRRPGHNQADVSDKPAYIQALSVMSSEQIETDDHRHRQSWRAMTAADDALEAMFDAMDTAGVTNRTAVFFLSDNGAQFGEHRLRGSTGSGMKNAPYQESVLALLHVWWPTDTPTNVVVFLLDDCPPDGVEQAMPWLSGQTFTDNAALVSNLDISPTVIDIIGGTARQDAPQGMSIVPVLTGEISPYNFRKDLLCGLEYVSAFPTPTCRWVIRQTASERWKYVIYDTDEEEVYDLVNDPGELVNLAGSNEAQRAALSAALDLLMAEQGYSL